MISFSFINFFFNFILIQQFTVIVIVLYADDAIAKENSTQVVYTEGKEVLLFIYILLKSLLQDYYYHLYDFLNPYQIEMPFS